MARGSLFPKENGMGQVRLGKTKTDETLVFEDKIQGAMSSLYDQLLTYPKDLIKKERDSAYSSTDPKESTPSAWPNLLDQIHRDFELNKDRE